MDINRIRYFCAISECGSLAKASQILGISPAALSKSMTQLMQETGLELFIPQGRGIALTNEGIRFAQRARELIGQFDGLVAFAKGPESDLNVVRIGSFEVFTTYLMGDIAQELGPNYQLHIHELGPNKIEKALLGQTIDFGLTYIPIATNQIEHLEIGKAQSGVYGRKSVFKNTPINSMPFIIPLEPLQGIPNKAQGLDGWQPSFGNRRIAFRVALMETALELARQGLGVAYLPDFVVKLHNRYVTEEYQLDLIKRMPKAESHHPVYLVKHTSSKENLIMKKVSKVLRRHLLS